MSLEQSQLTGFQNKKPLWDQIFNLPARLANSEVVPSFNEGSTEYRFFQIKEVNKDSAASQRLAMANVLSGLSHSGARLVYLLKGTRQGVELYIGVATESRDSHEHIQSLSRLFEGNYQGVRFNNIRSDDNCLDDVFGVESHIGLITGVPSFNESSSSSDDDFQGIERLANSLHGEEWQLMVVAEPGGESEIRHTLDQLQDLSTLASVDVKQTLQHSHSESKSHTETDGSSSSTSESSTHGDSESKSTGSNKSTSVSKSESAGRTESNGKTFNDKKRNSSITKNTGDSSSRSVTTGSNDGTSNTTNQSLTSGTSKTLNQGSSQASTEGQQATLGRERINKQLESLIKQLDETVIQRFQLGLQKGMFKAAIYVAARHRDTYGRLAQSIRSIFQGNQTGLTPLQLIDLEKGKFRFTDLLRLNCYSAQEDEKQLVAHSTPVDAVTNIASAATWLNTRDLSLLVGIPGRELPGIQLRDSVDFGLNTPMQSDNRDSIRLAEVIHNGRLLESNPIYLSKQDLSKHVFVTGVTGAGKTTTCMRLLTESGLPFMVIEPAKTEYRALIGKGLEIDIYQAGSEEFCPLRLNPFELVNPKVALNGHIATLTSTLTAAYPMDGAMPQLVEEAIIRAYEAFGWDLRTNTNELFDDPWDASVNGQCWPIFSDMIDQLDELIQSKGMGKEFEEKYRGSLVARLTNLTNGIKGAMLNTRRSLDFDALLDRNVVIELEELKSESDKALLMGLVVTRLADCMKYRHHRDPGFQHLTLIEEAHHLLTRPDGAMSETRRQGVETFANLLAEVRKYGEGLIIADQVPNKLVQDVIKNTHTKIVHRLFAADDRDSVGDAIGLDDEQKAFLPRLQTGETIIFCGGWNAPVWTQITQSHRTDEKNVCDSLLLDRGQILQWSNRKRLSPYLSSIGLVDDARSFALLLREAPNTINALLYWARNYNQSGADVDKLSRKLNVYQRTTNKWKDQLSLNDTQLHELIYALLLDLANLPGAGCGFYEWMTDSCKTQLFAILGAVRQLDEGSVLQLPVPQRELFDQLKKIPVL